MTGLSRADLKLLTGLARRKVRETEGLFLAELLEDKHDERKAVGIDKERFGPDSFLVRTVPAAVPSLFHSSSPLTPSEARKKSVPLTFVR